MEVFGIKILFLIQYYWNYGKLQQLWCISILIFLEISDKFPVNFNNNFVKCIFYNRHAGAAMATSFA